MRPQTTPKDIRMDGKPKAGPKPKDAPKKYTFDIVAAQCKICALPPQVRRDIDLRVASGWTQASILDHWNERLVEIEMEATDGKDTVSAPLYPPNYLSPSNLSNHAKKHVSTREAAVRKVIEERAKQYALDVDAAAEMLLTKEAGLEVAIISGLQNIIQGHTQVEPKEYLLAIQMLKDFESEDADVSMDEMWKQFYAFTDAVKMITPPDMWARIADQFERNLRASGIQFSEGSRVIQADRPELEAAEEIVVEGEIEEVIDD